MIKVGIKVFCGTLRLLMFSTKKFLKAFACHQTTLLF